MTVLCTLEMIGMLRVSTAISLLMITVVTVVVVVVVMIMMMVVVVVAVAVGEVNRYCRLPVQQALF